MLMKQFNFIKNRIAIVAVLIICFAEAKAQSDWSLAGNSLGGTEVLGSTNSEPLVFVTSGTEKARFTPSGQLLVGTTSLISGADMLSISNNQNSNTSATISNTNSGTAAAALFAASNGTSVLYAGVNGTGVTGGGAAGTANTPFIYTNSTAPLIMSNVNSSGFMTFYTGGSASSNERMRITSSGNLGIGTTSPGALLHINPTVTSTSDFTNFKSGITYNGGSAMTNWYGSYIAAPSGSGTITNKYAFVTESGAGNVGIGTTSPAELLQVGSSVFAKNAPTTGTDGFLYLNGTLPTGTNMFGDWCSIYNNANIPSGADFSYAGFYSNLNDLSSGGTHEYDAIDGICRAACTSTSFLYRFSNNSDPHASIGTQSLSLGASTNGVNFGTYNGAWNSATANVGSANVATQNTNGANVGVIGVALNGGSGTQNAGYFSLSTADPSYSSAALLADNGSTSSPVFLARVNGTTKDVIDANGNFGIGTSSPSVPLHINSGSSPAFRLVDGTQSNGYVLTSDASGNASWQPASGSGTVTSFSSGNLSPLFTTSVATSTTTPALSFSLNTQSANAVLAGPSSGSAAAPTFRALTVADMPGAVLQTASVSLTSSQILNIYTTPVQIVPAPGAGKCIVVVSGAVNYTFGTHEYDYYSNLVYITSGADYAQAAIGQLSNLYTGGFGTITPVGTQGNGNTLVANQPLMIEDLTAPPTNGDGTAKFYVTYYILTL